MKLIKINSFLTIGLYFFSSFSLFEDLPLELQEYILVYASTKFSTLSERLENFINIAAVNKNCYFLTHTPRILRHIVYDLYNTKDLSLSNKADQDKIKNGLGILTSYLNFQLIKTPTPPLISLWATLLTAQLMLQPSITSRYTSTHSTQLKSLLLPSSDDAQLYCFFNKSLLSLPTSFVPVSSQNHKLPLIGCKEKTINMTLQGETLHLNLTEMYDNYLKLLEKLKNNWQPKKSKNTELVKIVSQNISLNEGHVVSKLARKLSIKSTYVSDRQKDRATVHWFIGKSKLKNLENLVVVQNNFK